MYKKKLVRWGNSLSLRIPIEYLKSLGLKEGEEVEMEIKKGEIRIKKVCTKEKEKEKKE